jgi:hypothetical protein
MYSNKTLQQIYSLSFPLNEDTNLFCDELFRPGQILCIIIPFGLQYDRFSFSPLCSLVAALQSLKHVSNAVSWRTNIPMHNVHHMGRAL